jgi:hypothetical protein
MKPEPFVLGNGEIAWRFANDEGGPGRTVNRFAPGPIPDIARVAGTGLVLGVATLLGLSMLAVATAHDRFERWLEDRIIRNRTRGGE